MQPVDNNRMYGDVEPLDFAKMAKNQMSGKAREYEIIPVHELPEARKRVGKIKQDISGASKRKKTRRSRRVKEAI